MGTYIPQLDFKKKVMKHKYLIVVMVSRNCDKIIGLIPNVKWFHI